MTSYLDLHRMSEDERIDYIGHVVMVHKKTAAVCTDAEPVEKRDRYIKKFQQKFPGIQILEVIEGPTPGIVTIKVGPPDEKEKP